MANTFAVTVTEAWDVGCQAVSHKLPVMADAQELLARHMCCWTGTATIKAAVQVQAACHLCSNACHPAQSIGAQAFMCSICYQRSTNKRR